jgi:hypothetical protein
MTLHMAAWPVELGPWNGCVCWVGGQPVTVNDHMVKVAQRMVWRRHIL